MNLPALFAIVFAHNPVRPTLRPALLRLVLAGLIALGVLATAHAAEVRDVPAREIDALFARWAKPDSPGCMIAVVHDGKIIFKKGYGMADLSHDIPITDDTVFYLGSDSKQFAAFCIALLADRKVISLDDNIRKYLPEMPDYGHPITISNLVHHTSGIRDYYTLRSMAGEAPDGVFGTPEIYELICRQKQLNFDPGEQYLYSNSGYLLLSVIIKRASGKTLREFAAENIFKPLGMTSAQFRDDHTLVVKNLADGYADRKGGGYSRSVPNFDVVGGGGLLMKIGDFLAWDNNFYDAKIGGKEVVDLIQRPTKFNNGKVHTYAFGLNAIQYRGLKVIEHGGAYGGYRAEILRFPDQRFSVAIFANIPSVAPDVRAEEIADLFLGSLMTEPAPSRRTKQSNAASETTPPSIALSAVEVAKYGGEYYSEELATTYYIESSGTTLTVRGHRREKKPLIAIGADTFRVDELKLTFNRTGSAIAGFSLAAGRVTNLVFVRK